MNGIDLLKCESPIEREMLHLLIDIYYEIINSDINYIFKINEFSNQKSIKTENNTYRADFYFEFSFIYQKKEIDNLKLIIECDGHEFHEKTKEQVIKNNQRDRDLQNKGYEILHFSGSEILKNILQCREDIIKFIIGKYYIRFEKNYVRENWIKFKNEIKEKYNKWMRIMKLY